MSVDLDKETIEAVNKVNKALQKTKFDVNRFEVGNTMASGRYIWIDIRKHEETKEEEE